MECAGDADVPAAQRREGGREGRWGEEERAGADDPAASQDVTQILLSLFCFTKLCGV